MYLTLCKFGNITVFHPTVDLYPAMGLNGILANALESLSMDNNLVSWSIFNEKSGHISVKIRFRSVSDSFSHDVETHYRKKPMRQVQRDRERGQAWRAAKHSNSKHDGSVTERTVGADKPADHITRPNNSPGLCRQWIGIL